MDRDRVDRSQRGDPPAKRMRDEPRDNRDGRDNRDRDGRYDNRARNAPRGGREFVRGARNRGRGRGARDQRVPSGVVPEKGFGRGERRGGGSGGRGGSREYRMENHADAGMVNSGRRDGGASGGGGGSGRAPTYAEQAKFTMGKWGEDSEPVHDGEEKRRRDKDDDSDASQFEEEVSTASEDSASMRGGELAGGRQGPKDGRQGFGKPRDRRDKGRRSLDDAGEDGYGKDPRSPRDDQFVPKGEPSRRGRG